MQRVSTMSVTVKANGVSEAWYNGQRDRVVEAVRAEAAERIRMAREELRIERERAAIETRTCNRLRAEKLSAMQNQRRPGIVRRIAKHIESAWAYFFATVCETLASAWEYVFAYTVGGAWIDVLIKWKLIERIED